MGIGHHIGVEGKLCYAEYCEMHSVSAGGGSRKISQSPRESGIYRERFKAFSSFCIASISIIQFNATIWTSESTGRVEWSSGFSLFHLGKDNYK